jgi:hypothetical protein
LKLLILHLSDIHFSINNQVVTDRITPIVSASLTLSADIDAVLIVVSGDLACKGIHEEYELATEFVRLLKDRLKVALGDNILIELFMVPGNHDVDTNVLGDETIEVLSADILRNEKQPSSSEGLYTTLLSGQQAYQNFHDKLTGRPANNLRGRILTDLTMRLGGVAVRIRGLNTAIMSRRNEVQGSIWFPMELLDKASSNSREEANDFSICVYHHPDKWLESNNAGKFKSHTEASADLILMGHQHTPDSYYSESLSGDKTWYSAGAALQTKDDSETGFSVILLDFEARSRRRAEFNFAKGLYFLQADTNWKPFASNATARSTYVLTERFSDELSNPGNLIVHSQKKKVYLRDIYEPARLKVRGSSISKINTTIAASELVDFLRDNSSIIIFGEPQSGKTTLAKELFRSSLNGDGSMIPLLLNPNDLKSSKEQHIDRWIKRTFESQYALRAFQEYRALPQECRLLIVDNWQDTDAYNAAKAEVFKQLERWGGKVVLLADSWFQLDEFSSALIDGDYSVSINRLTILPYTPWQRTNMIERWITLGREDTINALEKIYGIDAAEKHLDEMTAAGLVPKYPLHILAVLQTLQAIQQTEPDLGSQGHLYDMLVDRTLKAMSQDAPDMTISRQFIAVLAGEIFDSEVPLISRMRLDELTEKYFIEYAIKIELDELLTQLVQYRMLYVEDGNYGFRERYVYYYFVAEYFAGLLSKRLAKHSALLRLKEMASYIAYEEYAQVLMFVIYKTRNIELIDEVILNSQVIFESAKVCDLDKDMAFVQAMQIENAPILLPSEDVERNRMERRKTMGDEDIAFGHDNKTRYSIDLEDGAKLQHAFKSMQMMGRILRNFPGLLEADTKRQLAGASYELGLRTLTMLCSGVREELSEARVTLIQALRDRSGDKYDSQQLRRRADQILTYIIVAASIVIISSISDAVGSSKLRETYRQLGREMLRTPATDLVNVAIELDNFRDIPLDSLSSLEALFKEKFVAHQVLRYLVWKRLVYLPVANRVTRQKLCSKFEIGSTPAMLPTKT